MKSDKYVSYTIHIFLLPYVFRDNGSKESEHARIVITMLTFPTFWPLEARISTAQYLQIQFHDHTEQYANFTNIKPIFLFRRKIAQYFEIHN